MKTLSIDTSSNICSLAILADNKIIYEDYIADKLTHSENLMPMIKKAFDNLTINLADIDLFACSKVVLLQELELELLQYVLLEITIIEKLSVFLL